MLATELSHPGVQICNAQPDVIVKLASRRRQRPVVLLNMETERNITERNAAGHAEHSLALEGWPGTLGHRHMAIRFGIAGAFGRRGERSIEMLVIPKFRAVRIFLKHMNVIEALGRHVTLIFDDGAIRRFEVRETCAV